MISHPFGELTYEHYMWFAITFFSAYFIGSLSFGYFVGRFLKVGDLRKKGSGSTGATNMLRLAGVLPALLTFLGDSLKGSAAIFLCFWFAPYYELTSAFVALGVILGHIFPFYLGFKGGKGVATFLAVVTTLFWKIGLILYAIWIVVALLTRYSSLASITIAICAPIAAAFVFRDYSLAWLLVALCAIIISSHRENIIRLWLHGEPKISLALKSS